MKNTMKDKRLWILLATLGNLALVPMVLGSARRGGRSRGPRARPIPLLQRRLPPDRLIAATGAACFASTAWITRSVRGAPRPKPPSDSLQNAL